MPIRVVIARFAWFAFVLVAFAAVHALVPSRALAFEEPLFSEAEAEDACSEPVSVVCPGFLEFDDLLPPGVCAEDGSARVAPPPSLPIGPDKIEGTKKCPLDVVLRTARRSGSERDATTSLSGAEPAEPATLPMLAVAPSFSELLVLSDIPYLVRAAEGVETQLERPPAERA
ncbi:MAG: hypothetical protein JNL21_40920 [Myxococcales bacterium]|nr:hypothetical protein [Myxococcales bacterium]